MSAKPATVLLSGRPGGTTHLAVELLSELPAELRLIGGLAVMCRVGSPHRATVDLDAVARDLASVHPGLASLAVSSAGGGQYTFERALELDVIEVAEHGAADLAASLGGSTIDLTDLELNLLAHTWAHDTASPLDLFAVDERDGRRLAAAAGRLVASPAGLIAMKVTTVPLRASSRPEKRASDLYDIGRLVETGAVDDRLASMPDPLRRVIVDRLEVWFVADRGRDRTFRAVRRFNDPSIDFDGVAERLTRRFGS